MLRLLGRFVLVIAVCSAIGLQWAALQSLAWTTMLIENSKGASLSEAIAKTFDGDHPCSLCHAVQKGKSQEKKSDVSVMGGKLDLICEARPVVLLPPFQQLSFSEMKTSASAGVQVPLLPPPRSELS